MAAPAAPQPLRVAPLSTAKMGASLCRCLEPAPLLASDSRAARRLKGGDRARGLFAWIDWREENLSMMAKLQVAVQAMANVPVKRGFNQWQTVIAEERAAKALLLSAVRGIINSKVRKVCNAWSSMVRATPCPCAWGLVTNPQLHTCLPPPD